MGQLYEMKMKVEKHIDQQKLDKAAVRGQITLVAGFLIGLVNQNSPDEPAKIDKLRQAAKSVLKLDL